MKRNIMRLNFIILLILTTIVGFGFGHAAWAIDYYVDGGNGNDNGDGSMQNPWKTITHALSQVSGTGHTIYVMTAPEIPHNPALGELFPLNMKNGVSLVGQETEMPVIGASEEPGKPIIDAEKTKTVIDCVGISDSTTRIEGFVIANGNSSHEDFFDINAGGIYIDNSSLLIQNNIITGSYAEDYGGGIYVIDSSPTIRNNTITENNACNGAGIYVSGSTSSPVIANNIITKNYVRCSGGGAHGTIFCEDSLNPLIIHNIIAENDGPGIGCERSSPTIISNTITSNTNGIEISDIFDEDSSRSLITNNILSHNSGYGIMIEHSSIFVVSYNLFFDNTYVCYYEGNGTYETVEDMDREIVGCHDNLEGNPLFVGDYHLQPGSAAIDAGDPMSDYSNEPEPNGYWINIGAYGNTIGATTSPGITDINLSSTSYAFGEVEIGSSATWTLTIFNVGDANLWVKITSNDPNFGTSIEYLTVTPGASQDVPVTFTPLSEGDKWATLFLTSNDQDEKFLKVTLNGSGIPYPDCTDWYVDGYNGSDEIGDGSQENPWRTITYALSQVSEGCINVAEGIYNPGLGEVFPINMKNGVSLVGAGADVTILDAESTASVINFVGISDASTKIEGFTITGGSNGDGGGGIFVTEGSVPLIINNIIKENKMSQYGGGIYALNSSPRIINNKIINNWGFGFGGGIAIKGSSSPIIADNEIRANGVEDRFGANGGGGGIYVSESSPTITSNEIKYNQIRKTIATSGPMRGGGIYISGSLSPVMITRNEIIGNEASVVYGEIEICSGIYMYNSAPSTIANNIIARNDIGGITLEATSARIINNTIAKNKDKDEYIGNGIHISSLSLPEIVNNIIYDNMGFGIYEADTISDPSSVRYNLLYDNDEGVYHDEGGDDYESCEEMDEQIPESENNLCEYPYFVDPAWDDYHLKEESPAIDAGDSTFDYSKEPEPNGGRINIGAYGNTEEATTSGPSYGTISGYVTDCDTGKPIRALVIVIQKPTRVRTFTDKDGYYEISGLKTGEWWLICTKKGYKRHIAKVKVPTTYDFCMESK